MVISGGVNIYPAEIEHELVRYPGVADCVVFGVPDASMASGSWLWCSRRPTQRSARKT